jgi:hypothetical protein
VNVGPRLLHKVLHHLQVEIVRCPHERCVPILFTAVTEHIIISKISAKGVHFIIGSEKVKSHGSDLVSLVLVSPRLLDQVLHHLQVTLLSCPN